MCGQCNCCRHLELCRLIPHHPPPLSSSSSSSSSLLLSSLLCSLSPSSPSFSPSSPSSSSSSSNLRLKRLPPSHIFVTMKISRFSDPEKDGAQYTSRMGRWHTTLAISAQGLVWRREKILNMPKTLKTHWKVES